MKRSTDRVLTTHTGSLPRAADLTALLEALDAGTLPDPAACGVLWRRRLDGRETMGAGRCILGRTWEDFADEVMARL